MKPKPKEKKSKVVLMDKEIPKVPASSEKLEVSINEWLVIEFEIQNGPSGLQKRRYIAQLIKVKKGKLWGKFLQPASTAQHRGYV